MSKSECVVQARHAGLRADVYVAMQFPSLSRTRVKQKIMQGESLLNGRRFATSARMRPGDRLELFWRRESPPPEAAAPGCPADSDPPLQILYEDEHLIAVDKPAGLPVHPTGRKQTHTLIQMVRARERQRILDSLAGGETGYYPGLVNRLDLFTSGVVLVAKDRITLAAMHRHSAAGGMRKRYLAVVAGLPDPPEGRIDLPIGPDPASPIGLKQTVRQDGRPALTEYRVIERMGGHTLLELLPRTGRQHQLRVHLAAIGHPVWGDLIYADPSLFLRYVAGGCRLQADMPPRHALHAEQLGFRHPLQGRELLIRSPAPADFLAIAERLRGP